MRTLTGVYFDGLSSPQAMARRAIKIGAPAIALTDHGTIAGVPSFFRAISSACATCGYQKGSHDNNGKGKCLVKDTSCEKYIPSTLKGIAGSEFYLCEQSATIKENSNRSLSHLCVLSKNARGWQALLQATSEANKPEHFYYKPRLDLEALAAFSHGNWIAFSGHPGSDMANILFDEPKLSYRAKSIEEAHNMLKPRPQLMLDACKLAERYARLFGRDNFFIEIQRIDQDNLPAANVISEVLREVALKTGLRAMATPDAHYPTREDAPDQRILLCSAFKTTLRKVNAQLRLEEDVTLGGFFRSNNYHIPDVQDLALCGHTKEELAMTLVAAEMCETYRIDSPPRLPKMDLGDHKTSGEALKEWCRKGWKDKIADRVPKEQQQVYIDQFKTEFKVLDDAGLHDYFLVVADIIKYSVEELKCPPQVGRGSCAGSLIGYLMDIHDCDPIEGKLFFSRFYNDARNMPAHITFAERPF